MAQVHRFGDKVAAWLGQGPTTYMTPQEARHFGEALIAAAENVKYQPKFSDCNFHTVNIPVSDPENKNRG